MATTPAAQLAAKTALETPILTGQRHARSGIPYIRFLDDIGDFIAAERTTLENVLEALHTMLSKYKLLESGLVENRKALRLKIPDIAASLDAVKLLQERRAAGGAAATFGTYFALADQVHARAAVDAARGTVFLWLGANVMLEYGYDEARALLETNLANATQKVDETAEELDVLREQIITTEVNMARVFNFDVMKRREDKLAAAGKS